MADLTINIEFHGLSVFVMGKDNAMYVVFPGTSEGMKHHALVAYDSDDVERGIVGPLVGFNKCELLFGGVPSSTLPTSFPDGIVNLTTTKRGRVDKDDLKEVVSSKRVNARVKLTAGRFDPLPSRLACWDFGDEGHKAMTDLVHWRITIPQKQIVLQRRVLKSKDVQDFVYFRKDLTELNISVHHIFPEDDPLWVPGSGKPPKHFHAYHDALKGGNKIDPKFVDDGPCHALLGTKGLRARRSATLYSCMVAGAEVEP